MKRLAMIAATALLCGQAMAEISYDYIEAGGTTGSVDMGGVKEDVSGFTAGGSFSVGLSGAIRPYLSHATVTVSGADVDMQAVGADLVLHKAVGDKAQVGLFIGAADIRVMIDALGYEDSDTGTRGGVEVRAAVAERVELSGSIFAEDSFGSTDNAVQVGLLFMLAEHVNIGASYTATQDEHDMTFGLRYDL